MQRANSVATGLGSMGIHSVQLTTEQIIELFYGIYNPGIADKERFTNAEDLTSSFVADTKERPKDPEGKESPDAKKEEEEVIDNSGIVQEKYKQEAQTRQMAADNAAERQIGSKETKEVPKPTTPVATVPTTQTIAPVTPPPANPAANPAIPPAKNIDNDVRPAAPAPQNQPPAAPSQQ